MNLAFKKFVQILQETKAEKRKRARAALSLSQGRNQSPYPIKKKKNKKKKGNLQQHFRSRVESHSDINADLPFKLSTYSKQSLSNAPSASGWPDGKHGGRSTSRSLATATQNPSYVLRGSHNNTLKIWLDEDFQNGRKIRKKKKPVVNLLSRPHPGAQKAPYPRPQSSYKMGNSMESNESSFPNLRPETPFLYTQHAMGAATPAIWNINSINFGSITPSTISEQGRLSAMSHIHHRSEIPSDPGNPAFLSDKQLANLIPKSIVSSAQTPAPKDEPIHHSNPTILRPPPLREPKNYSKMLNDRNRSEASKLYNPVKKGDSIHRVREIEQRAAKMIQRAVRKYMNKKKTQQSLMKGPKLKKNSKKKVVKMQKFDITPEVFEALDKKIQNKLTLQKKRKEKKETVQEQSKPQIKTKPQLMFSDAKSINIKSPEKNSHPVPVSMTESVFRLSIDERSPSPKPENVLPENNHFIVSTMDLQIGSSPKHEEISNTPILRKSPRKKPKEYKRLTTFNPEDSWNVDTPRLELNVNPNTSHQIIQSYRDNPPADSTPISNIIKTSTLQQQKTPQFQIEEQKYKIPLEVEEEKQVPEANISPTSDVYQYSEEESTISQNNDPLAVKFLRGGESIVWNLYFTENGESEDIISSEILALRMSKWDVVVFKEIKFEQIKALDLPSAGMSRWTCVSLLMPNCLNIFKNISLLNSETPNIAPGYDSGKNSQSIESVQVDHRVIEQFVENSVISAVFPEQINLDLVYRTLDTINRAYPRCGKELELLRSVSEFATESLILKLESLGEEKISTAKIVEFFSMKFVEECMREICHLFVLVQDFNGQKLKLSKNIQASIDKEDVEELARVLANYRSPMFGNELERIEPENSNIIKNEITTERVKLHELKHEQSYKLFDNDHLTNSIHEDPKHSMNDSMSEEESSEFKQILEPMGGQEEKGAESERQKSNRLILSEYFDLVFKELKLVLKAESDIVTNELQEPIEGNYIEKGTIFVQGEKLLIGITISKGAIIEKFSEINNVTKALGLETVTLKNQSIEITDRTKRIGVEGGEVTRRNYSDNSNATERKFQKAYSPEEIFQETISGYKDTCIKFLITRQRKDSPLYLSYSEFVELMHILDPLFDLREFLQMKGFTPRQRLLFYQALEKRFYKHNNSFFIKLRSINAPSKISKNPEKGGIKWSEPFLNISQTYRAISSLTESHMTMSIREALMHLGIDSNKIEGRISLLGGYCSINGRKTTVNLCMTFIQPKGVLVELIFSNIQRLLHSQVIPLTNPSKILKTFKLFEKFKDNRCRNFFDLIVPQNFIKREFIWGDRLSLRKNEFPVDFNETSSSVTDLFRDAVQSSTKINTYRMTVNSREQGKCFVSVTNLIIRRRGEVNCWNYTLGKTINTYQSNSSRFWSLMLHHRGRSKHFEMLISDTDFQSVYYDFTKKEKVFFELFRAGAEQHIGDSLRYLEVLAKKLSIQPTDVGTIMMIDLRRKPNPNSKEIIELTGVFYPLKEYLRQRTIMMDAVQKSPLNYASQYSTNARYTILQTTTRQLSQIVVLIVYYMIPLNYWKIKIRVPHTGRVFIFDIDANSYSVIRQKAIGAKVEAPSARSSLLASRRKQTLEISSVIHPPTKEGKRGVQLTPFLIQDQEHIIDERVLEREIRRERSKAFCRDERQDKITMWAEIISSLQIDRKNTVMIEEQGPLSLKEILFDGMIYAGNSFVYAEVELVCTRTTPIKSSVRDSLTSTESFVSPFNGIPQNKIKDYKLILMTTQMSSLKYYTEEIKLNILISQLNLVEEEKSSVLSYGKLTLYAAHYANNTVHRQFQKSDLLDVSSRPVESVESSFLSSRSEALPPAVKGTLCSLTPQFMMKEVTHTYEQVLSIHPPLMGRILICNNSSQVLLRLIDSSKHVFLDTPISFQQASCDCKLPLELFNQDKPFLGKRLMAYYRSEMLKQYSDLY